MTGASASPKPKPVTHQRHRGDGLRQAGRPHVDIQANPAAASTIPAAVTTPSGSRRDEVAADQGADRQRHQQPDQHQRGVELRVG